MAGNDAVAQLVSSSRATHRIVARTLLDPVPKPTPGPTITTAWLQAHYDELKKAWQEMQDDARQTAHANSVEINRLRDDLDEGFASLLAEIQSASWDRGGAGVDRDVGPREPQDPGNPGG